MIFVGLAVLRAISAFGGGKRAEPQAETRLGLSQEPSVLRYPPLPPHLKSQLNGVTPSIHGDLCYYPCLVKLQNGDSADRVYLVSEAPYLKRWAVYPGQDSGRPEVSLADIASLTDSPSRLPAQFASELYKDGEAGMGSAIFTVVFGDGSRQVYQAGGALDFIEYPGDKGPADVAAVLPGEGRADQAAGPAPYAWCVYSE